MIYESSKSKGTKYDPEWNLALMIMIKDELHLYSLPYCPELFGIFSLAWPEATSNGYKMALSYTLFNWK
jgi:hypothetical protein